MRSYTIVGVAKEAMLLSDCVRASVICKLAAVDRLPVVLWSERRCTACSWTCVGVLCETNHSLLPPMTFRCSTIIFSRMAASHHSIMPQNCMLALAVDSTSMVPNSSVVKSLSERRIFCEEKQGNVVHVYKCKL